MRCWSATTKSKGWAPDLLKVWAVINTIWSVLNYIAASEEEKSGDTFGWSTDTWTTLGDKCRYTALRDVVNFTAYIVTCSNAKARPRTSIWAHAAVQLP